MSVYEVCLATHRSPRRVSLIVAAAYVQVTLFSINRLKEWKPAHYRDAQLLVPGIPPLEGASPPSSPRRARLQARPTTSRTFSARGTIAREAPTSSVNQQNISPSHPAQSLNRELAICSWQNERDRTFYPRITRILHAGPIWSHKCASDDKTRQCTYQRFVEALVLRLTLSCTRRRPSPHLSAAAGRCPDARNLAVLISAHVCVPICDAMSPRKS